MKNMFLVKPLANEEVVIKVPPQTQKLNFKPPNQEVSLTMESPLQLYSRGYWEFRDARVVGCAR